jgi:SnoaL-like domain
MDMSRSVELVRRSFQAMGAWDVDELLRLYAPDVEFLPLTGTLVESGGYRGHEGVRAYSRRLASSGMCWSLRVTSTAISAIASWWPVAAACVAGPAGRRAIRCAPGWSPFMTA